ncbi:hypothetical protein AB0K67_27570 [Nonomuraea sp. NPDC052634]|uniref:hypothetical protein n=1 Tax=Nonomuraea sp. NPDC052634 TaxID=3155813 RepID=UPI003421C9B1
MSSPIPPRTGARALGLLLVLPALVGTLITLVLPTAQTIWLSFQSGGVLREISYAGTANYAKLFGDDASWRALGLTVSLIGFPLLVALVVGPLLALALDRAGTWVRRAGRVLLSLAVVTFSPVAVATSWLRGLLPESSGLVALAQELRDPATAPGALRLIVAAATFGLVCALAVIAFLPALRGGTPRAAAVVVGVLVALAVVAAGLQTFALGQVLTGAQRATQTLAGLQYDYAFREAQFGLGAAVATLTGAVLGVLGIAATVIAVASGLRITLTRKDAPAGSLGAKGTAVPMAVGAAAGYGHQPAAGHDGGAGAYGPPDGQPSPYLQGGGQPARAGREQAAWTGQGQAASPGEQVVEAGQKRTSPAPAGMAIGIAALAAAAVAAFLLTWPWMDGALASRAGEAGTLRTQINTWLPALVGALVSVGVAYLAALGIGGLRPLGRASEWLLLIFAPWLFVGSGPLSVANWHNARSLGLIDTFAALIPPLLVSVPALLVLTLLCKGLAERTDRDFFSGVFLPSLPMAGILTGAVTLVNAHDVLWPLLVVQKPELHTAPVAQMIEAGTHARVAVDIGGATPLLVVAVALAALVAAQLLYLDRLTVTTAGSRVRKAVP